MISEESMSISDKLQTISKKIIVLDLVLIVTAILTKVTFDVSSYYGAFDGHVYGFAKTTEEMHLRENEFFKRTGFDVNRMSIFDKCSYGRLLTKEYTE